MNLYKSILGCLFVLPLLFVACSDIEYDYNNVSNGKEISDFTIPSLGLVGRMKGTLDATKKVDTIYIVVSNKFDLTQLKNVKPSFAISVGSSVTPAIDASQDFSSMAKYTVTSESGQTKDWFIKTEISQFIEEGAAFESSSRHWYKEWAAMGLTANVENTIAAFEDKIVVSRTGLIFDGRTGASLGTLNMDGIVGNPANPSTNIPFVLTNDDAGNLIGGTLGAWSAPYFRVYKWNALNQPPQQIISFEAPTENIGPGDIPVLGEFGRKIVAGGNINESGYIASYNYKTADWATRHNFWRFEGGVLTGAPVWDKTVYNSKSILQQMYPAQPGEIRPYFVCDYGSASVPSFFIFAEYKGSDRIEYKILGNIPAGEGGGTYGWGARMFHMELFSFNKRDYIAVVHATLTDYYLTVLDRTDPEINDAVRHSETIKYNIVHQEKIPGDITTNGNGTVGIAYFKVNDADGTQWLYLYGLMTSKGVVCVEINNLVK